MISIVITSFKEPKTIGKAIESFLNQNIKEKYELIISAPDKETLNIAREYSKKNKQVKIFKDPGKGKSYALNLLLPKLKGRLIILTDGDVYVSENSINEMTRIFEDKKIGCITARPISQEDKTTKFGYWANLLFDAAHKIRKQAFESKGFIECSGYLWAFRNKVIKSFPLDVAEDSIIPYYL